MVFIVAEIKVNNQNQLMQKQMQYKINQPTQFGISTPKKRGAYIAEKNETNRKGFWNLCAHTL